MPPPIIKNINGKMNLDCHPSMIPPEDYGMAFNIVRDAEGIGQDRIVSNMVGNTLVPYTLHTGNNKRIGSKPDLVRNRIYIFIWNSLGYHQIVYYDAVTNTINPLCINLTNSNNVDILGFNPSYRINHIDIVYRNEGDLMYWTDGLNPPSKINVQTAINGGYGTYIRSFLNAAKEPPASPPYCVYETDPTVTVNTMRKKLFRIKTRFIFDDLEKSSTSSISEVPLPIYDTLTSVQEDPTKNADIFMVLQTGAKNVIKIEVLAQQSLGNVWSDFFSVAMLNKADLGLNNNDVCIYRFYNNQAYNYIDVTESDELFDYVPQKANTQALANGNTLAYSAITENYDLLTPLLTSDGSGTVSSLYSYQTELLYAVDVVISGVKYTKIIVAGVPSAGDIFNVIMQDGISTDDITYTVGSFGDTISNIVSGLNASAVSAGYAIISSVGNTLVISKVNTSLLRYYITIALNFKSIFTPEMNISTGHLIEIDSYTEVYNFPIGQTFKIPFSLANTGVFTVVSATVSSGNLLIVTQETTVGPEVLSYPVTVNFINSNNIPNVSIPTYDWNSKYEYAIEYLDGEGTTNGALPSLLGSFQTVNYTETNSPIIEQVFIPSISLSIYNRPPLWAKSYNILRTKDLSKSAIHQWISDRTFKDLSIGNQQYQYAYISIAYLNQYIVDNPSSFFLAYGFTPNDRIRFIKRYATDGTTASIYTTNDYEIIDSLTDPIINAVQQLGQILKIILPATSTDFDFGGQAYANYFIEIYTPALSVANNLKFYYEFGETYLIGNSGTNTAFHYGMNQNQSTDLAIPATFTFTRGDYYFRQRTIPVGNEIKWNFIQQSLTIGNDTDVDGVTIPMQLISQSYNDPNYVVQSNFTGIAPSITYNIVKVLTAAPYTVKFNISGSITFVLTDNGSSNSGFVLNVFIYNSAGSFSTDTRIVVDTSLLVTGQTYSYTFNQNVMLGNTTAQYMVVGIQRDVQITNSVLSIVGGDFILKQVTNIDEQGMIDSNFSDSYQSAVNSNGRALIYDPNAKQTFFPTLIRHGQAYQDGTNINGLNRFYSLDFDEYDRSNGAVTKLFTEGKYLYVFQQFDIGIVPVLQQIITDTANNPLQADSTKLLNTIQYPYKGKYGMTFPESFAYYKDAKYGIDGNKKVAWRLSQDGLEPISILYECNAYFQSILPAFNNTLNNGNPATGQVYGGNPTVYGGFDFFTNKYIIGFEQIDRYDSGGNLIFHQDPATIVFWETREANEGFECFTNYYPEGIDSLGSLLFTFKNGKLYLHNNTTLYCNFYGVQYSPIITLVFNKDPVIKKTFNSLSYKANQVWTAQFVGDITTSTINQQTGLPQISQLIDPDFTLTEGQYDAAFLCDANSMANMQEGLVNGDKLKGTYIIVKLTAIVGIYIYMYLPYITYSISPKNL